MSYPATKLLVFTDLDGTLLDHHDYNFAAAKPMLSKLETLSFPVIPTTSKTRSELIELRQQLNNKHPFIVENGAAVFIPQGYFPSFPEECIELEGYWVKAFGLPRASWQEVLLELPESLQGRFKSFWQLGDEGVAKSTGLELDSATRANTRDYSEPLLWEGSDEELQQLADILESKSLGLVAGGRFIHLHNGYNKGIALKWLADCYRQYFSDPIETIALGDSDNDIEMLQAAHTAIVIQNPVKSTLEIENHKQVMTSTKFGPEGWFECLDHVLNSTKND